MRPAPFLPRPPPARPRGPDFLYLSSSIFNYKQTGSICHSNNPIPARPGRNRSPPILFMHDTAQGQNTARAGRAATSRA